ncbi:MAG: (d)CMP kinase [Cetobacterium sp.]|uniref:(d)CMP kinase n=1 Tax=Cetobacterium TaxID=180162 RepID=UPI00225A95ED|nr:(d)CMP kinase [Cetobacterium somerae]MCX3067845.1 (d)CMP kinase [Cetobacterium somerae]
MKNYIIALDGPAGSGKSTIAKVIAKNFGLTYLDTGAMYRMVALYILENNIDFNNVADVENILNNIKVDIIDDKFILNGKDVSLEIRTPEVTKIVSPVSAIKAVRVKLVDLQREISKGKKVILDGRDIGTVVFPNADLKVFLVASPEERAKRRVKDYASKGITEDFETVLKDILERDHTDSTRKESPLKKAEDAIEVDTSFLNIEESVQAISNLIKEKIGG